MSNTIKYKEQQPVPTEVFSAWNEQGRVKAAALAQRGEAVGAYNLGVCGIWGDGAHPSFPLRVAQIKGEKRGERPLAASLETSSFVAMLDPTKIPEELHDLFLNADELAARLASLCLLRAPITEAAAAKLPASLISRLPDGAPLLQNWDPAGHEPTHLFVEEMHKRGIVYPAVTSMNPSGTPELVTEEDGIRFSRERNIPLFLRNPRDPGKVKGSYTIIELHTGGLELIRDGNIPARLLELLLGIPIHRTERTIAPKHQQAAIPEALIVDKNPAVGRAALLKFLSTK
ncbi:hypothetical protein EPA93_20790 [Ktedonosporobacter rubrisoli]|uniref:YrdC-like domain-containing protein n=1 Tax=Ktedonosporobacter rubrisoli TaxID=2509675 RepID=A0A4P6JSQ4_KTERU|nr:hypothetical protein [Ktedonosporobacter rubrisoli]QBD78303.1 hypothetical protein EPA93_20790 [Ktedonosporobacter rubrisoli]